MSDTAPLLRLRDVHKSYPSPDARRLIPVLTGVDLVVPHGRTLAVLGPSGSGKTTLLLVMGALAACDRGSVLLEGRELAGMDERQLARTRTRSIGFVFQTHRLLPYCTAWENVLVPTLALGRARDRDAAGRRARRLLDRVGLGDRLGHRPAELSGGECLRVAVARALINTPRILLADEPTGSLDEGSARELGALLLELNREEGTSLVVVTHSATLAARMDQVLELRGGVLR